jgi:hypothetical protein
VLLAALLPVVQQYAAEQAAEALEAAADWIWDAEQTGAAAEAYHHLRDRADALRADTDRSTR